MDTINACINGYERCFTRHAAKESLALINSGYPRKRKPAKADPAIERQVQDIIRALPDGRFIAVPTSAELQPLSGVTSTEEVRSSDDTLFDTSQGVDIPRLVPDEVMEPNGQPEEESQVPEARPDTNVANVIKAKTWDALKLLFNGEVWVDENSMGKICILCGSPHHVFVNCKVVNPLRQQIADVFEHVKKVIETHPDAIVFQPGTAPASQPPSGERASGSNDRMETESVASSGRRPKPKARPRQNNLQQNGGVFIVRYGYTKSLVKAVQRRRGDYNYVCVCVVRTSLNWVFQVIMIFKNASRRVHVRGITAFRNVAIATCFVDLNLEDMRTRAMTTSPMVFTVESLRNYHHVGCNFAILHGKTASSPNRQRNTHGRTRKMQRKLSFIQKDLRHHIGRRNNAIYLDKRCESPIATIKCDEGGWVNLEWLMVIII